MDNAVVVPKWKKWRLLHRKQMRCRQCGIIFNYPANCKNRKYCNIKCQHLSLLGRKLSGEHKNKISIEVRHSDKYREGLKKRPKIINSGCFVKGQLLGKKHPNWKGGKQKTQSGYILKYAPNHPHSRKGYVLEHRLVIEAKIKRYLDPKEVIHHLNKIKDDNQINNLKLYASQSEHVREDNRWITQ